MALTEQQKAQRKATVAKNKQVFTEISAIPPEERTVEQQETLDKLISTKEKRRQAQIKHRQQSLEADPEGYLKKNAEYQQRLRDANREKHRDYMKNYMKQYYEDNPDQYEKRQQYQKEKYAALTDEEKKELLRQQRECQAKRDPYDRAVQATMRYAEKHNKSQEWLDERIKKHRERYGKKKIGRPPKNQKPERPLPVLKPEIPLEERLEAVRKKHAAKQAKERQRYLDRKAEKQAADE